MRAALGFALAAACAAANGGGACPALAPAGANCYVGPAGGAWLAGGASWSLGTQPLYPETAVVSRSVKLSGNAVGAAKAVMVTSTLHVKGGQLNLAPHPPVHCVETHTGWGACTASCGGGVQQETFVVHTAGAHGGDACSTPKTRACNEHACPVDCVVDTLWGDWTTCSAECDGGTQTRHLPVLTPAAHGGAACPTTREDRACNTQSCKCPDGQYEETPKDGQTPRVCKDHKVCPAGQYEFSEPNWLVDRECEPCPKGHRCPGDHKKYPCGMDTFQSAEGKQSCTPCSSLNLDAQHTYSTHGQTQQLECTPVPVDCVMGTWGAWDTCTKSCGGGNQARVRTESISAWGGGATCTESTLDTQLCNTHACPVDCVVGEWGAWDDRCTKTCGDHGTVTRTRVATTSAQWGGLACPTLTQSTQCNVHSCDYKPECDQAHVHCRIATIKRSGLEVRVPRMTHHRKFMHIAANYVCKMSDSFTECKCTCDKQPPCCLAKNLILKNEMLKGNRFANVASTHDCCDMCYAHPQCTSWEYAEMGGAQGNVCVLKTGVPSYEKNPAYPTVTYVGTPSRTSIRPGQSSCDPPFYVERDPSLAGIHPGPGHIGDQATTGPHQLHPFAGAPWDKIEIATHQMTDTPVNGLPGHAWVEAQDKEAVGSALEWQRGRVDVRDQPQGQD